MRTLACWSSVTLCALLALPSAAAVPTQSYHRRLGENRTVESKEDYMARLKTHLHLFQDCPDVQVRGPSAFPPPTHLIPNGGGIVVEKPKLGQHRPDKDVVVAFAAEYQFDSFLTFIESLRRTGFDGDIVLGVSSIDLKNKEIHTYLASTPGVVVYSPDRTCYNFEGDPVESSKGGTRVCECPNMFAHNVSSSSSTPLPDPRAPRTLATLRYELYWLMIQPYQPDSWILVVDARDTYFQTNPFASVPRRTDPNGKSGLLYFFGENVDATRLGRSKHNLNWLSSAYGTRVGEALKDKPTICSGASLGEQVAMDAYVRAIVAESDETKTVLTGADQGFHNFLYYSRKLVHAEQIHRIVVFDQGTGIVNNLGAMRTQPLEQWGHGKILNETSGAAEGSGIEYQVLNWDGTPSPVVHQFDRHERLSKYFFGAKGRQFREDWKKRKAAMAEV